MAIKYKLAQDDSGHDYVIPSDKSSEWYLLDFEDFDLPDWAKMVEGGLEFENPTDFGKLCFPEQNRREKFSMAAQVALRGTKIISPLEEALITANEAVTKHHG